LAREEKFTEALDHLNQAYSVYSAQGIQRSMGYNLASRGDVLGRLGRFEEARALLAQAGTIADKPGGELKRLSLEVQLTLAEIALREQNFASARSAAEKALAGAGTEFKNVAAGAKIVIGLSEAYSGAKARGKQLAREAVDLVSQFNDPSELAKAQLAFAAALALAGDPAAASTNAVKAEAVFTRLDQPASGWQALLFAAQASQDLGDKSTARAYAMQAQQTLSKLEQRWGAENFNSYTRRPDVQGFRKQLDQLAASL
jgi:tetratricopeptide (TPR) repeat protein